MHPPDPQQTKIAGLFLRTALIATVLGVGILYRGLRRVNPSDIVEGNVVSTHGDTNGRTSAIIEYTGRDGQRRKWSTKTDTYVGLGQIVPLILTKHASAPELHVESRLGTILLGIFLLLLAAGLAVLGFFARSTA